VLFERLGAERVVKGAPACPARGGRGSQGHTGYALAGTRRAPRTGAHWGQGQLDAFVDVYNTHHPHRALDRATPSEAWHARPVATPTGGLAGPHCRVRRDIINSGRVTLRHNSRLHHIGLGHAHNGTRVLILAADLHVRVITQDGQLLRELELDPTRDYQPRGVKPGPKPAKHDTMSRDMCSACRATSQSGG
jgi:hypothetical protein